MGFGSSSSAVKVAKATPAATMQDENVKAAGDDTRRRLAAANGRDKANSFFTAFISSNNSSPSGKKQTMG